MKVKEAKFKRILKHGEAWVGDVEVRVEGDDRPYIVLFGESKDQDFDMVAVLRKDVPSDADWYDEESLSAYEDVTVELFTDDADETHWGPREAWKESVLSFGQVREEIAKRMAELGQPTP